MTEETPRLDPYPSAPTGKAARQAWLDERTAHLSAGMNPPPDGATWGSGKDPKPKADPKARRKP